MADGRAVGVGGKSEYCIGREVEHAENQRNVQSIDRYRFPRELQLVGAIPRRARP